MKRILGAMTSLALLSACTNDNMPAPGGEKLADKPIVVNAGVDDLTTRTGMTDNDLSSLGLTILNPANDNYSYTNVEYIKSNDGSIFHTAPTYLLRCGRMKHKR